MKFARLVVTAVDDHWLEAGLRSFCGYGTSVIQCDAEVGVERRLPEADTPDGRPGASVLLFGFSRSAVGEALVRRVGQCLLTCPTTAVFDGQPAADNRVPLGRALRYFGDGYQKSKLIGETRYWRIPVMDGEFVVQEDVGTASGIGGGNFLIQASDQPTGLRAARAAVDAISHVGGVITPFPGGVARSGSKVGSRYKGLVASTAEAWCPTLRGRVESALHPQAHCVYEIVLDGVKRASIEKAMRVGVEAALQHGAVAISAGNYGGKLGRHHFHLREVMATGG